MANIQNELNNIKNALFGQEVRGSIHDGIDAINKEVESTTSRQVDLESTFDQLVINAGNSNAEIVDARVKADGTSYSKLGDRLDSVDSQLEHNTEKISVLNSNSVIFVSNGYNDTEMLLNLIKQGYKNIKFNNCKYFINLGTLIENCDGIILQGVNGTIIEYIGDNDFGLRILNSNNITINNIKFTYSSIQIDRTADKHNIEFNNCSNIIIQNCEFVYSKSMGVVFINSINVDLLNNKIHDTLADGVHFLNCGGKILVNNNEVFNTKDDGIAFNNYTNTTQSNYGSNITNNLIYNCSPGRGILINGCKGVNIDSNTTNNTGSCGIRVGCDREFGEIGSSDIKITNNTVINSVEIFNSGFGAIEVGEWDEGVHFNKINQNIIINNNLIINSGSYGLYVYSSILVNIHNNTIKYSNRNNNVHNTSLQINSVDNANINSNNLFEDGKIRIAINIENCGSGCVVGNLMYGMLDPNIKRTNSDSVVIGFNNDSEKLMSKFKLLSDTDINGKILNNVGRLLVQDGGFIRLGSTEGDRRCIWFDGATQKIKVKLLDNTIKTLAFSD